MLTTLDILEPAWHGRFRWTIAAIVVVALHVGGALAMLHSPPVEDDADPEGAMMMELAAVAVALPERSENLAIGAPSEDSVATPATEEVKEEQPKEDLPQLEEAPLVENPEVVLEKVKPEEVKEKPEDKPVQEAQPEMLASLAAAPPPIDVKEIGPKATAPNQGMSRKPNAAELTWQKALYMHISNFKRYPDQARSQRVEGVATVIFSIDGGGNVSNVRIYKGSGSSILDDAAVSMLRAAAPLPAPPKMAEASQLSGNTARTIALPIKFNVR